MTVQDQLKRLLDQTPDISLVEFGDLSSGLILNWAARRSCPREVLDLLGQQAVGCLGLLGTESLLPDQAASGAGALMIHFTEQETHIFTRQALDSDDVLCTVCEPGAELEPLCQVSAGLARAMAGAS